jgi:hypothetical protein
MKELYKLFSENGIGLLLLASIASNIYLTLAFVRRARHYQLTELKVKYFFIPEFGVSINKDAQVRNLLNEVSRLETENALLRRTNRNFILGALLLVLATVVSLRLRFEKPQKHQNEPVN